MRSGLANLEEKIVVQGKEGGRRRRRMDAKKSRRRHADHREGHIIDENRLSDRTRRSPKALLAGRKADDRDRRCAWTVVSGVDQTSRGSRHYQAPKILATDDHRPAALCHPTHHLCLLRLYKVIDTLVNDGI